VIRCRSLKRRFVSIRDTELEAWKLLRTERIALRTIVYLLVVVVGAFAAFVNIAYGVSFTSAQNNRWLASIFIAFLTGEIVWPIFLLTT
jgi:hypothetical protein